MITPQEIKKQANRWYPDFLRASLKNGIFFPKEARFGKIRASQTLHQFSSLQTAIETLRAHSKEKTGFGYNIEFIIRKDQKIGSQSFPHRIYFEEERDYLKFIGKEREYTAFRKVVENIHNVLPKLDDWIWQNPLKVVLYLAEWPELLKICRYFLENPKPNLYIRELPIDVHTKYIEENKAILKQLLEFLVPEHVNWEDSNFERRFHLKEMEPVIRLRILDPQLSSACFSCITDLSIPQSEFAALNLHCKNIFIIENKTSFSNIFNFLTLPHLEESIAIFGSGFGLGALKNAAWLQEKNIFYWGDIDTHGFHILSQLRASFPQTLSFLMDFETFHQFAMFRVTTKSTTPSSNLNLTEDEMKLYRHLQDLKSGNRLEQERIPHSFVMEKMVPGTRAKS